MIFRSVIILWKEGTTGFGHKFPDETFSKAYYFGST